MKSFLPIAVTAMALIVPAASRADVSLPKIFGNNMVLQADRTDVPVWGKAEKGEAVKVTLGDKSVETAANDQGKWMARIATPKAGGPFTLTVQGKNKVEFTDVYAGEVWVCSGQSNMEWSVAQSLNPKEEAEKAKYPLIRMIKVQHNAIAEPQEDINGAWAVCSPETVPQMSAVAYYFARKLHEETKMPIGLISTNWGGTLCEAWTSKATLEADPDFAKILERGKAFQPGKPNHASVLYNGMIHPLLPYGIRGAIWYQGESNLSRAEQYQKLFPAMIQDWRKLFGQGDFPFLFVQLAPYNYGGASMADTKKLGELWEAQFKTLSVPNTGMAVTTDIGNVKDIHPKNKQEVGRRLALWALAKTYGKSDLVYSGPLYKASKVDGDKIRIQFDHAQGMKARDGKPLSHFTICGEDKNFVPAKAEVVGEEIVVSAEGIAKPIAVRFAWHDHAEPNFVNGADLPASPFRTDDFPRVTAGEK